MYDASIEDIYKVITDILNGVLTSHKVSLIRFLTSAIIIADISNCHCDQSNYNYDYPNYNCDYPKLYLWIVKPSFKC